MSYLYPTIFNFLCSVCSYLLTVTSLSKHDPCRPRSHLHFLSSSDEHDCPPQDRDHVKDPTTEWPPWLNDVHLLTFPSIATFQLSPIPTSTAPSVRNTSVCHQCDSIFLNLYLQSLTIGCHLKTLRDADIFTHHSSILKSNSALF